MTGSSLSVVPVYGLVLAGGLSRRFGRDKGAVDYHGEPQVRRALRLLGSCCEQSFVSIRQGQAAEPAYAGLPSIVDSAPEPVGPAGGLSAAHARFPSVAWLLLAADMPLVAENTLRELLAARDPKAWATAYRAPDGRPEPLCAIWEPAASAAVVSAAGGLAAVSLRRVLEAGPSKLVRPEDAQALQSVNTPEDAAQARSRLQSRPAGPL